MSANTPEPGSMLRHPYPPLVEQNRQQFAGWTSPADAPWGCFQIPLRGALQTVSAAVIVGDGLGWDHVSVSLPGRKRCPTWDEMCAVRDLFFRPEAVVLEIHPRAADYVNDHPYVLHLWQWQGGEIPCPPPITVGLGRKAPA